MWKWLKKLFSKKQKTTQQQVDELWKQLGQLKVVRKKLHQNILKNFRVKESQAELNECNRLISNIEKILGV